MLGWDLPTSELPRALVPSCAATNCWLIPYNYKNQQRYGLNLTVFLLIQKLISYRSFRRKQRMQKTKAQRLYLISWQVKTIWKTSLPEGADWAEAGWRNQAWGRRAGGFLYSRQPPVKITKKLKNHEAWWARESKIAFRYYLTQQVLRIFFLEFLFDYSVCFPIRPLDMRSGRKNFCRYRKYAF